MDFVLHAYCGLYCGACPVFLSTRAGIGTEQCHGCKSEQTTGYCSSCRIRACTRGRGHEFCNECAEYKRCPLIENFLQDSSWPYQRAAAENMDAIKQVGLTNWLAAQERRWRCGRCGAAHSWWDETCPSCGQATASYRANK